MQRPKTFIKGHHRGYEVVPLDSTGMISYYLLIVPEAVSCIISEMKTSTGPTSLYLATLLAFTPNVRGPETISVKDCMEVSEWLGYEIM